MRGREAHPFGWPRWVIFVFAIFAASDSLTWAFVRAEQRATWYFWANAWAGLIILPWWLLALWRTLFRR